MEKIMSNFTPEYTYEKLNEIYKETLRRTKDEAFTRQEAALGMAAAYAIDFIDTAKAVKVDLDITAQTEGQIAKVMTAVYFSDRQSGRNHHDSKALLEKKFAYYQLFSIVNSLNVDGITAEIAFDGSTGNAVPRPVIRTVASKDGKVCSFDVLDAAERTIDKFKFNKPNGDGPLFVGTLSPFYQRVKEELIDHIMKA